MDKKIRELHRQAINYYVNRDEDVSAKFRTITVDDDWIEKTFNDFYVSEWAEWFFDSEPDSHDGNFTEEEYNMYLDYQEIPENEITVNINSGNLFYNAVEREVENRGKFSKYPHTLEELKTAYDKVCKAYADYEPKRLQFKNWVELYSPGNFGMSEKYVNDKAKEMIKYITDNFSDDFRFSVVRENEDGFSLYVFARDTELQCDYPMIFKKKN